MNPSLVSLNARYSGVQRPSPVLRQTLQRAAETHGAILRSGCGWLSRQSKFPWINQR